MKKHWNEIFGLIALALFYLAVLTLTQGQLPRLLQTSRSPSGATSAGISIAD